MNESDLPGDVPADRGGQVVHLEPDPHLAAQLLLPWYLNGRLGADEQTRLEAHLAGCPGCRAELETERRWQQLPAAAAATPDAGWSRMQARLDAEERGDDTPRGPASTAIGHGRPAGRSRVASLARWGWIAPTAMCAVLLLPPGWRGAAGAAPDEGLYHALSAAPMTAPGAVTGGTALVRFRPEATEADLRHALQRCGARLVDGPTLTDAYLVRLPPAHYVEALAQLRAQPSVQLAEALEAAGTR